MASSPTPRDELDEKLDYILKSNAAVSIGADSHSLDDYELLIPAIKQAFKDAGYMTGQEWYDSYRIEWNKLVAAGNVTTNSHIEAAKRAAGIQD